MNKEELMKMNKEQLNARLKELGVQAKTAAGDILDGLLQEANDIKDILDMAKKREALQKVADGAEDPKVDEGEGEPQAKEAKVKVFDKRGSSLKAGTPVTFNARIAAKKIQNSSLPSWKRGLKLHQVALICYLLCRFPRGSVD